MKSVIKVLSICFLAILSLNVNAATINGSFGVVGGLSATGGADLSSVTDISLSYAWGGDISNGDTSNVVFASANPNPGAVASLTSFAPVSGFLSIEGWSLELTSLSIIDQTSSLLSLEGTGTLTGNGFDPTDATWTFSTTSIDSYNMSVQTVAVVPVPAAVWLFGSGLIGLVGVARRKV